VVEDNVLQNPLVDEQHKETVVDSALNDPAKCLEILKKLGLPDPSVLTPSGKDKGGGGLYRQCGAPFQCSPPPRTRRLVQTWWALKQTGSLARYRHQQNGSWTRRCSELCVRGSGGSICFMSQHVSTTSWRNMSAGYLTPLQ